ncbi:hypothetical protein DV735_g5347, partial [Chaetothyriales sp. CBS 134920]
MSSTEPIRWKQLQTSHSATPLPPLFYTFRASGSGLTLQLTDQTRLWQCSLSKAEINANAAEQQCSIDPSESSEQMTVFLRKIEESLETGKNGVVRRESNNENLCLSTRISLPRPLAPLVFVFSLDLASPSVFSRTIVQPALATIATLQAQLSSLEHHIQEKDHVISKLLDRIRSQSIDMSIIFPRLTGIGGRNGSVTVEMAKKRIAGMEAFDRRVWEQAFDRADGQLARVGDLLKGVVVVGSEAGKKDVDEKWMLALPLQSARDLAGVNASQSQSQRGAQDLIGNQKAVGSSEDEFERQATPPGLRKKRASPGVKETVRDHASTSDRDDAGYPAKKRKIGGLRKKKRASPGVKETVRDHASTSDRDDAGYPAKKRKIGGLRKKKRASPGVKETVRDHASTSDRDDAGYPAKKRKIGASYC